jgi:hypothetical protein
VSDTGRAAVAAFALVAAVPVLAADNPQQAFSKAWEGRSVLVRQSLYTLVYHERGKFGQTRNSKRDGLTVVTPSEGVYFQFDGRQGRDDVVEPSPQRIVDSVNDVYQGDALDVRSYRKVEPVVLERYDPGAELVVLRARVDLNAVRLAFARVDGDDAESAVTWLTVKWPVSFSKSFSERDAVENLILRFVGPKSAS